MLFGLLFALAGASSARSQTLPAEASTAEASGLPQQELFVTVDGAPNPLKGRLVRLGSDTLTLVVNQQPMTVPLAGVIRIEVPGDPIAKGAIIGAAVFGAWCAFICGQGLDDPSQLGSVVAVNTVLGAAIGAAIDAAHKGRTPIYQRRAVSVHLDAGPDRPGVTRRGPATMAPPIRLGRTARLSLMWSYAF